MSNPRRYKGLFTLDEWRRQILPKLVQECRKELLQKRALGKKGARVSREALLACVREKARVVKEERLRQIAGA
jgi:hypothetical protein